MKKRLCATLCAMILLVCAALPCASGETTYKSGVELYREGITDYQYKAGEIKKYDEPITLTFGRAIDFNSTAYVKMAENGEPVTDNRWIQLYRDAVNVNAVHGLDNASGTDYNQQLLLAMASGELPDVFLITDLSMLNQMAEAGVIMDLTELWQANANETLGNWWNPRARRFTAPPWWTASSTPFPRKCPPPTSTTICGCGATGSTSKG